MNFNIEYLGYIAVFLNIYSFIQRGEINIRKWSFLSNLTFFIYAININSKSLIIGTVITMSVHLYNIYTFNEKK